MERKIIVLLGSPRKKGNSSKLAEQVAGGARAKGAEVETFYLNGMKIRPCQACMKCREEGSKGCAVDDDMQTLYPKVREADAIVIATPVYWFNMSAQTKTFLDRCYALGADEYEVFRGKQFAILLSYADSDPFLSGAVNALRSFQDTCRYLRAEIVGTLYGSATEPGEIEGNPDLMLQAYRMGEQLAR